MFGMFMIYGAETDYGGRTNPHIILASKADMVAGEHYTPVTSYTEESVQGLLELAGSTNVQFRFDIHGTLLEDHVALSPELRGIRKRLVNEVTQKLIELGKLLDSEKDKFQKILKGYINCNPQQAERAQPVEGALEYVAAMQEAGIDCAAITNSLLRIRGLTPVQQILARVGFTFGGTLWPEKLRLTECHSEVSNGIVSSGEVGNKGRISRAMDDALHAEGIINQSGELHIAFFDNEMEHLWNVYNAYAKTPNVRLHLFHINIKTSDDLTNDGALDQRTVEREHGLMLKKEIEAASTFALGAIVSERPAQPNQRGNSEPVPQNGLTFEEIQQLLAQGTLEETVRQSMERIGRAQQSNMSTSSRSSSQQPLERMTDSSGTPPQRAMTGVGMHVPQMNLDGTQAMEVSTNGTTTPPPAQEMSDTETHVSSGTGTPPPEEQTKLYDKQRTMPHSDAENPHSDV